MFIICKVTGHHKYSCGLLETVLQAATLPQHLRDQLVNHRFANTRGEVNSNIPLDLLMEHENRQMKSKLRAYRGTYTQNHLDSISKGSCVMHNIERNIDNQVCYFISKGDGSKPLDKSDIDILIEKYKEANLFSENTGRSHSPSLSYISSNTLSCVSKNELLTWMQVRLSILKTKNYYKQFHS